MLDRKAEQSLVSWKNTKGTQALLVTGARGVGKTTLVRQFAKQHYTRLVEVNLRDDARAAETLAAATDAGDLRLRLSAISRMHLAPGETLVLMDEVQELDRAPEWLGMLEQLPDYDFVLAGSLVGLDSLKAASLPVGMVQQLKLGPLDFEEFCWACGVAPALFDRAREAFDLKTAVPDYLHTLFADMFNKYLLAGGMPSAVQALAQESDLPKVRQAQKAILDLVRADLPRYACSKAEKRHVVTVFDAVPGQLNQANKRFHYTHVGKNLRYAQLESVLDRLESTGSAILVPKVAEPVFPLGLVEDPSSCKVYSNDVGLLTAQLAGDVDVDLLNGHTALNFGSVCENAAAQELRAHGHTLRYFNTKGTGEVDFVLERAGGDVVLCDVACGKDYHRHRALGTLLRTSNYPIAEAYVLGEGNISVEGGVVSLPLYLAGMIPRA